jgi:hypothetical protein
MMTDDDNTAEMPIVISQPQNYFYEPDPAVIRAGMVRNLMLDLNAAQVDRKIAYLTSNKPNPTPFARVWEIEDWFPFQLKRLRAYLRARKVGLATVKKRESPILPEELIWAFRLPNNVYEERVLFLTQFRRRPIMVVCHPELSKT